MKTIERVENTGFHSQLFETELESGQPVLLKHYMSIHKFGFEVGKGMILAAQMKRFTEIAGEIGVPMPPTIGYYLTNNHNPGRANVVEVVPRLARDLRQVALDPAVDDIQYARYLRAYLELFRRVWDAGFPISLDPPVANFCLDEDGTVYYIDLMPPRQVLADGRKLSEYPDAPAESERFIEDRYFSALQARVIYAQVLRTLPGRKIAIETIRSLISDTLGDEARSHISFSPGEIARIVTAPNRTDVDAIRCLSVEAFIAGAVSDEELKNIYHETHIGVGGILPPIEDVRQAASRICEVRS